MMKSPADTVEAKMKIEVWSDIMCPFCYIGKRHYENALKEFAYASQVELEWKSFQLDPDIPEDIEKGWTSSEYLASRKGISKEQVVEMHNKVTQMAEQAGLEYHLDNTKVFNSFNAHRILQSAKMKGLGNQAEETFFKAHFTDNKDLGDVSVLIELAKQIGLTQADAQEALDNESYAEKVQEDLYEARQVGARGVPFFVFNRKYAISGAQPVEVFLQTMEKSFADWTKDHPDTSFDITGGNVCTPDGQCD